MYRSHNHSYLRFLRTSAERDTESFSFAVRTNAEAEKESTQLESQMRHFPLQIIIIILRHANNDLKELAYTTFIRSILENSSAAWNPIYQKDIDRLEIV